MKNNLVFIDVETTGLDPVSNEIIEICCIKVRPDGSRERLYYKARIESDIVSPVALKINGYNPRDWEGAISQEALANALAPFLDGCIPVGHNIKFDMSFILELLDGFELEYRIDRRWLDTYVLAYEHLQPLGLSSLSMDSIRDFLGWSKLGSHTAIQDCEDVYRLFYFLLRFPAWKRWSLWLRMMIGSWMRRFYV